MSETKIQGEGENMSKAQRLSSSRTRAALMGTSILMGLSSALVVAMPAFAQDAGAMETVTVTGYRASLTDSTNAKRASVGFTDSVFAEDIGKFPDTNIAEALNRIPGVTISREVDGSGVNVSIRGLGTNFTKILLNGNPITVATTGGTDSANNNREVDLNMFPTELFTQLTVSKTPSPDQIEGGAAGTITMRSMRPFDKPGLQVSYNIQATDQSTTNMAIGKRGTLVVSNTWGSFGLLAGISGVQSNQMVTGWEDGNAGWNLPNLPAGTCGTGNTCGQFGSGAWTILPTIPAGMNVQIPGQPAGTYYPAGTAVTQSILYALNPGLADPTCSPTSPTTACLNQMSTRLSNSLIPRLGRSMFEKGSRDRYNAILSAEYRPSDDLHIYADFIFGRVFNDLNRSDMDWGVRNGNSAENMLPVGLTLRSDWLTNTSLTSGLGGAVESGQFYGAVYGLEARRYREKSDFISINPGLSWDATDLLHVDLQANYTRSHFFRQSPTIMVTSCEDQATVTGAPNCPNGMPVGGPVLTFSNTGSVPNQSINLDLNDPGNFQWDRGRVNMQAERRYSYTLGTHLDVTYGGEKFAVKAGAAYDESYRLITAIQNDVPWQNAVCGNNPSVFLPGPNSGLPTCTGQNTTSTPSGYTTPAFPGYGTGYSQGFPALTYAGSLVPTSALSQYLVPGPTGFITANYDKFFAATGYNNYLSSYYNLIGCTPHCNYSATLGIPVGATPNPPYSQNANTGGGTGGYDDKTVGLYLKAVGTFEIGDRTLKYEGGLRWFQSRQSIITPVNTTDPRNCGPDTICGGANAADDLQDGGKYPNYFLFPVSKSTYQAFLPSLSLVYEVADDFQVRASISRTMSRPNPSAMVGALQFSDPNVSSASLGNPNLTPYYSNNIDIGAELYTGAEGYIGMSLFRKSISGFYNQVNTTRTFAYLAQYGITWATLGPQQQQAYIAGGPGGFSCNSDTTCANQPLTVTQQVNIQGLEIINGMEFDYVQPLDFLTEEYLGVKGFGFNGNVTIIDQKSTGSVPTYATGVAPLQYNLTGYYEDDGVMLRLSYNWNDRTYGSGSNTQNVCLPAVPSGVKPTSCPGGAYIFGAPYGQADFSSSVKLSRVFGDLPSDPELTFDVQNVFSAKAWSYVQLPDAVHSYYIKGQTYLVGLRGTF
jgi:TonB-dependent receptor